ncbi:MAG: PTS sugar transporter subunit IIC, partial [Clostridium sp.]|nr:PTS sugar transporter subunit IIC [Clostridium sp.]
MFKTIKRWLNDIFVNAMSGMAIGLFATLIIGTILAQIGSFFDHEIGRWLIAMGNVAKTVMGAGIGIGVASKYKAGGLLSVSAAVAGF